MFNWTQKEGSDSHWCFGHTRFQIYISDCFFIIFLTKCNMGNMPTYVISQLLSSWYNLMKRNTFLQQSGGNNRTNIQNLTAVGIFFHQIFRLLVPNRSDIALIVSELRGTKVNLKRPTHKRVNQPVFNLSPTSMQFS